MANRYKKVEHKRIASERIEILFDEAEIAFKEDPKLSDKYVQKARTLSMRYKVKMPRQLRRKFCHHCYSYLVPGKNLRIRTRDSKVIYYCLNCKKYMRFVMGKKQ
jgi:ribonuclease P protein subunit RPR2